MHLWGQAGDFVLNAQRGQARTQRVVLQSGGRAEHRHDAVAGELVHRAAVAPHHRRSLHDEFGHDLTQPLRTHCGGDVHGVHHIGEQHRHLLVLRGVLGIAVGVPHSSQNFALGRNSALHLTQLNTAVMRLTIRRSPMTGGDIRWHPWLDGHAVGEAARSLALIDAVSAPSLVGAGGTPHDARAQQPASGVDERGHPEELIDRDGVVFGRGEHAIDVHVEQPREQRWCAVDFR